ncbi:MAG: NAD(P)/FAD-dependent oxidoreductase [Janthinobacterium lividum]
MTDFIIIGAGTVGAALAYGLARKGGRVTLLDGDDSDHRAARANFGLVWLQGKGAALPSYHQLTQRSVEAWSAFNDELAHRSKIDMSYENQGGLVFCLSDEEFEKRRTLLLRLHNAAGGGHECEMVERSGLERLLPGITFGPDVVGASYGHTDGHCNPLKLLAALQRGIQTLGGQVISAARVEILHPSADGFRVETAAGVFEAPKIVIAAGLGTSSLAKQVDIDVPVHPERGQILVTERCERFLPLPCSGLRQTAEGTVMIGATSDKAGFDTLTTGQAAAQLAEKASRIIPRLGRARLVRQWAGLRVMSPDGFPIYAQSPTYPGAFVALCHSGVTLAALHATELADAVIAGSLPESFSPFHQSRFDVSHAA